MAAAWAAFPLGDTGLPEELRPRPRPRPRPGASCQPETETKGVADVRPGASAPPSGSRGVGRPEPCGRSQAGLGCPEPPVSSTAWEHGTADWLCTLGAGTRHRGGCVRLTGAHGVPVGQDELLGSVRAPPPAGRGWRGGLFPLLEGRCRLSEPRCLSCEPAVMADAAMRIKGYCVLTHRAQFLVCKDSALRLCSTH